MLKPAKWPVLARSEERQLVWGECQGSGSTPYRVCGTLDDLGYTCSCPSRKFPCKHTLALFWFVADRPASLTAGAAPEWVEDWLGRRKRKGPTTAPRASGPKDIRAAVEPAVEAEDDAKKAAASARAAEKRRAEREEAILGGLDELDRWIGDVLGEGLGVFPAKATERCRRIASRLVDAKSAALGTRLDELPGAMFALPEEDRQAWLLGELGRLALLTRAYRRLDTLPAGLREDVRRLVGWSTTREALLDDPAALRVDDTWTVVGVREQVQVDRLVRRETWLRRHGAGTPDFALLLDHSPVTARSDATFATGEVLRATLAFHPSAAPLRAIVATRDPNPVAAGPEAALAGGHDGLDEAVRAAQALVAMQPWLDPVPMLVGNATLGRVASRFALTTPDGAFQWVVGASDAAVYALAAAGPATVACLLEAGGVRLLSAATKLGFWEAP